MCIRDRGSSNGDSFLIATAILEDGIIVTDEGNKNNGIPMVCESLGVESVSYTHLYLRKN